MTEASKPTVVVDNLHIDYKTFASGKAANDRRALMQRQRGVRVVHALKGVSFVVHEGESIGVIGHNGSGKSTLMRSIAGLHTPARGAVYAASRPALLGVNAALIGDLTGDRNVMLGGLALGMTPSEVESRRDDIVDFSGIREFIDLPMKAYSSGMAARLRFSIAISRDHQILLVDEALAVGDKDFRAKSEQRIRDLREQAGTVFLVSHSMRSIMDTCTRVLWIDHGTLKMDGDPKEVVSAYKKSR
ncbi:ABC transporter ATP-binding protein [Demequina mangrovi]|uniref:Teichoic acid transport system ATP-binding protein n=1 Tax=Demequina mangrovi TaxID=1043493 RepID=A0A1H7A0K7_9MICO|nr:ABC transporter ATP-binding protein [Demequina mangrovi]SEJ59233.1 teichoic acid transport system ATP-binding protein [Demequina mangrovi]